MIDARTALLVGTAILSPYLLATATAAGVPLPVYVTDGQRAALAAFPATVAGVSTTPTGTSPADTSSLYARWNSVNESIKATQGSATNIKTYVGHPEWTPTNFAALNAEQAVNFANAVIAAADAGAASASESYNDNGYANASPISDAQAYQDLQGLLATDATWGADADSDAGDYATTILALVLECDQRGYLPAGKPFVPTLAGGLNAASSAVGSFVEGVAGKAAGAAAGLAADVLMSTPVLVLLAGLLVYRVAKK